MNDASKVQKVIVTDIHMPFWSIVAFMVKSVIAAIPAIFILVLIVMGSMALSTVIIASIDTANDKKEKTTFISPIVTSEFPIQQSKTASQPGFSADVPDRCKGSTELEKCIEFVRQMSTETDKQKSDRKKALSVPPVFEEID
jgi:hypothetical protein